jgi:hypothetical protein
MMMGFLLTKCASPVHFLTLCAFCFGCRWHAEITAACQCCICRTGEQYYQGHQL